MDKIVKARARLILDKPFYGSLALRLNLVEDPTHKTGWTDGTSLGYNPAWIDTLNADEIVGFVAHEVMHCANGHHVRREGRDPKKWNVAGDITINDVLIEEGFTLPKGALTEPGLKGFSTERVFNLIPDPPPDDGSGGGDAGNCGEVRDATQPDGSQLSESDKKAEEQKWKVAVAQSGTQAKAMGESSAAIDKMVKEIVNPKIDWRELLRRFIDEVARNDYSWVRPDRRYVYQGVYLPGMHSDELGRLIVAVDTSGSIYSYKDSLDQFSSELKSILDQFSTTCDVIHCDNGVRLVEKLSHDDDSEIHPKGGGGTDFRPPFELIEQNAEEQPACMIYFTDGICSLFPERPNYPVLWVVYPIEGYNNVEAFEPPFGEVVSL